MESVSLVTNQTLHVQAPRRVENQAASRDSSPGRHHARQLCEPTSDFTRMAHILAAFSAIEILSLRLSESISLGKMAARQCLAPVQYAARTIALAFTVLRQQIDQSPAFVLCSLAVHHV